MNKWYYAWFLLYFLSTFIIFSTLRLFFSVQDIYDREYEEMYVYDDSFLELSLDSPQQIPFLRLHRDPPWENIRDNTKKETILDWDIDSKIIHEWSHDTNDTLITIPNVFIYPPEFGEQVYQGKLLEVIYTYLAIPSIERTIQNLSILLFVDDAHTRWRMFRENIYLYSLGRLSESELTSVFIHEFWHYHDIYGFSSTRFWNLSERFYNISWVDTDIIRPWQSVTDFVSGYAMTNKYEDFAESYTYYVLHNSAFLEKTRDNIILKQKYDFFERYAFSQKEFYKRNFSTSPGILSYYWDITKIEIDLEKFLQYLYLYL